MTGDVSKVRRTPFAAMVLSSCKEKDLPLQVLLRLQLKSPLVITFAAPVARQGLDINECIILTVGR